MALLLYHMRVPMGQLRVHFLGYSFKKGVDFKLFKLYPEAWIQRCPKSCIEITAHYLTHVISLDIIIARSQHTPKEILYAD